MKHGVPRRLVNRFPVEQQYAGDPCLASRNGLRVYQGKPAGGPSPDEEAGGEEDEDGGGGEFGGFA